MRATPACCENRRLTYNFYVHSDTKIAVTFSVVPIVVKSHVYVDIENIAFECPAIIESGKVSGTVLDFSRVYSVR